MELHEYFVLKTQIKQKWLGIIFALVFVIFLQIILESITGKKDADIIDKIFAIIFAVAQILTFVYAAAQYFSIDSKTKKLKEAYKNGKSFSEAAKMLELSPENE